MCEGHLEKNKGAAEKERCEMNKMHPVKRRPSEVASEAF